jgi:hypothetical protein
MPELKPTRVQELTWNPTGQCLRPGSSGSTHPTLPPCTVQGISNHRMPKMGQVHTDLVGSACFEGHVDQIRRLPLSPHTNVRHGPSPIWTNGHLGPIPSISPQGGIDNSGGLREVPPGKRSVQSTNLPTAKRIREGLMGGIILGYHK